MTAERPTIEELSAWLEQTSHSPHSAETTISEVMIQLVARSTGVRVEPATSLAARRPPDNHLGTFAALASAAALVGVLAVALASLLPGTDGPDNQPAIAPVASASAEPVAPERTLAPRETAGLRVAPGSMTDAGSLAIARKEHTATLLDDGHVLIVGGQGGGHLRQPLVDLWDPDTLRFEHLPDLEVPRKGHTATRLQDGRVLITGGYGENGQGDPTATVEIWDPSSQTSSFVTDLLDPRADHTATLLPDGRVLIVGGRRAGYLDGEQASAEIWDPRTEASSMVGSLAQGRSVHTASLLDDGRVLIVGGMSSRMQPAGEASPVPTASVEIWEPASGGFTELSGLTTARYGHTATVLHDGSVLILGGASDASASGLRSAELWHPRTGVATTTSLEFGRLGHTATLLEDGRVLIVGGTVVERAEVWDPATKSAYRAGATKPPRQYHTATRLADGRVLVVAGRQVSGTSKNLGPLESAQLWAPVSSEEAGEDGPLLDPASALTGDATLARRFPASVDGQVLSVSTRTFEAWRSGLDPEHAADADFQARLSAYAEVAGVGLADINLATATYWQGRNAHALAAVRTPGVEARALVDPTIELMLGQIIEPSVEWIEIAGRTVARVKDASLPGAYPSYVYPDGDTIWLVQSEEPILSEIFAALP